MLRIFAIALLAACGGSDVSRELGAECDVTSDCDARCLAPSTEFPAGFCTRDCSTNRDCPDDSECVDRQGGVCLFSCGDDGDCMFLGPGWICHDDKLRENPDIKTGVCRGD